MIGGFRSVLCVSGTGAMKSVDEERIVDVSGNLTSLDKKLVC